MLTQLDNMAWAQAELDGNGQFVEVGTGTLYVVSNVRADNSFVILKSTSVYLGQSFTPLASYTFPHFNEEFAPAVCYDSATQLLHIVGLQNNATNSRLYDLIKFTFDTGSSTLTGPVVLATGERIRSNYDIVPLSNGDRVVSCIMTSPVTVIGTADVSGHSVYIIELDSSDSSVSTTKLLSSPERAADLSSLVTYNSVTMVTNGTDIELYYEIHPRLVTYKDQLFQILQVNRTAGVWGTPAQIYAFGGRYSDDTLTVIAGTSGQRYLVQNFWTQSAHPEGIVGNMVLGYFNLIDGWNFNISFGDTVNGSFEDSALSVSAATGVKVVYLFKPFIDSEDWKGTWRAAAGPFYSITAWNLTNNVATFTCNNELTVGDAVALNGFGVSTFFNGSVVTVTARTATQFTAIFSGNNGSATEAGVAGANPISYTASQLVEYPQGSGFQYHALTDSTNKQPDLNPMIWELRPTAWPMRVAQISLTDLALTDIFGFYNTKNFSWLRGTKSTLDDTTSFAVVAEIETSGVQVNTPFYVSGVNVPPTAVLTPTTKVMLRNHPFQFDASGSNDGDNDPIIFNWIIDSPQPTDTILQPTTDGQKATTTISAAVGGAAFAFTLAVVTADLVAGANGLSVVTNVHLNGGTLTITANNGFAPGDIVGFKNFSSAAWLNGQQVTVLTATATQFTAAFTGVDYGPTGDSGNCGVVRHPSEQITNVAISANVATLTVNNSLQPGDVVLPFGLTNASFLNLQPLTVLTATGSQITANFTHSDFTGADSGLLSKSPAFVTAAISVPLNTAPGIVFPTNPINAARNTVVTITPMLSGISDPDDTPSYFWQQTAGTPVTLVNGTNQPILIIQTNGVALEGETLTFSLLLGDGVNDPAEASVDVVISAYTNPTYDDTLRLSRSNWTTDGNPAHNANIAQRNTAQIWSTPDVSIIYNNLKSIKRNSVTDGTDRYLVISDASVLAYYVYPDDPATAVVIRHMVTPTGNLILDAVNTETDQTLILAQNNLLQQQIYRYTTAPIINTDNPDTTLDLTTVTSTMVFNKITCTVAHDDVRVIALSGPDGCLLMQVRASTLEIQASLALTVDSSLLNGADDVIWVRFSAGVESIRSGRVLLGTLDNSGASYETLVDLSRGSVVGAWDATKLTNKVVSTGEFLFESGSTYSGLPSPPVLQLPYSSGNTVSLSWTQNRPDLASGYELQYSNNGGASFTSYSINSGFQLSATLTLPTGNAYQFKLRALSPDGTSGFSNVQTAWVGIANPPSIQTVTSTGSGPFDVTVTWLPFAPDASLISGYQVQMSTDAGAYVVVATINNGTTVSTTINSLAAGHTYLFRVAATVPSQQAQTGWSTPMGITL